MHYFCTYFDRNYLALGLALYRSLQRHVDQFELNILCLDDFTYKFLAGEQFPNIKLISLTEFEVGDSQLLEAKGNRRLIEYYYTLTPNLPLFLFRKKPEIDVLTYLDADLFFYSSPEPIYKELGSGSMLIVPHRFAENMRDNEKYGVYNVGLLCFKNDATSKECLSRWRAQCLEWCYEKPEDGKNADQKYLDDWTSRYEGVVVLQNKGAGLGTWNIDNYEYRVRGKELYVDDDKLVFYHFHGLKMIARFIYQSGRDLEPAIVQHVYAPYIRELQHVMKMFREVTPPGTVRNGHYSFIEKFKRMIYEHSVFVIGSFGFAIYLRKYLKPFSVLKRIVTQR